MSQSRPHPGFNFLHYRQFDFPEDEAPKVLGQGGATVAYTQDEDGSIRFSVAICRDDGDKVRDNYNHTIGRNIAVGRLKADKFEVFDSAHAVTDNLAKDFIAEMDEHFAYVYGYFRRCKVGAAGVSTTVH